MFKRFFLILLTLFFQLEFFVTPVAAIDSCDKLGISLDPTTTYFPQSTSQPTLIFDFANPQTITNLNNQQLEFRQYSNANLSHVWSQAGTITNGKLSLALTDSSLISNGVHTGYLYLTGGSDTEICSTTFTYQIGIGNDSPCVVDQNYLNQNPVVPGGKITIKFLGLANTHYNLKPDGGGSNIADFTTDSQGQGVFNDVTVNGSSGDIVKFLITNDKLNQTCHPQVRVSLNAGPVQPPAAGPVAPGNPQIVPDATPCTSTGCSSSGGQPCSDNRGTALKTAIGCVHTNPIEFIKDFTTFIIAVSGGLAFLMMLLGAFQMVTSAGNPDSLNNGRQRLTSAVIGLLFVIFATLIMQVIGLNILQIPGFGK